MDEPVLFDSLLHHAEQELGAQIPFHRQPVSPCPDHLYFLVMAEKTDGRYKIEGYAQRIPQKETPRKHCKFLPGDKRQGELHDEQQAHEKYHVRAVNEERIYRKLIQTENLKHYVRVENQGFQRKMDIHHQGCGKKRYRNGVNRLQRSRMLQIPQHQALPRNEDGQKDNENIEIAQEKGTQRGMQRRIGINHRGKQSRIIPHAGGPAESEECACPGRHDKRQKGKRIAFFDIIGEKRAQNEEKRCPFEP